VFVRKDGSADIGALSKKVENYLKKPQFVNETQPVAILVNPSVASMPQYDLFIYICVDGRVDEIWGYLCNTGKTVHADQQTETSDKVNVSVWLCGDPSKQPKKAYEWRISTQKSIEELFGFSLGRMCPPHWVLQLNPRGMLDG